jgi:hypothetical protein
VQKLFSLWAEPTNWGQSELAPTEAPDEWGTLKWFDNV